MGIFRQPKFASIQTGKKDNRISGVSTKEDWFKCKGCSTMLQRRELPSHMGLCHKCGYHYPLTDQQRIELITDKNSFKELDAEMVSKNVLGFEG